jgi:hypothetical protein
MSFKITSAVPTPELLEKFTVHTANLIKKTHALSTESLDSMIDICNMFRSLDTLTATTPRYDSLKSSLKRLNSIQDLFTEVTDLFDSYFQPPELENKDHNGANLLTQFSSLQAQLDFETHLNRLIISVKNIFFQIISSRESRPLQETLEQLHKETIVLHIGMKQLFPTPIATELHDPRMIKGIYGVAPDLRKLLHLKQAAQYAQNPQEAARHATQALINYE